MGGGEELMRGQLPKSKAAGLPIQTILSQSINTGCIRYTPASTAVGGLKLDSTF